MLPRLEYTDEARRECKRYRQFPRRHSPLSVTRRTGEILDAVRWIRANPEINPVRRVASDTGLRLRRQNSGSL
jgi:hypothetical protein